MERYESYALLAIGAVAPYLIEAGYRWISGIYRHRFGANAPCWHICHKDPGLKA